MIPSTLEQVCLSKRIGQNGVIH